MAHDNGLPTAALAQVLESGAGAGEQPTERMRPKLCEGRGCGMRIRRRWCEGQGQWWVAAGSLAGDSAVRPVPWGLGVVRARCV